MSIKDYNDTSYQNIELHCSICHMDYWGMHICPGYDVNSGTCLKCQGIKVPYTYPETVKQYKYCPHCGEKL